MGQYSFVYSAIVNWYLVDKQKDNQVRMNG